MNERKMLQKVQGKWISKLYSSFSDKNNLYMVLGYAINGDLASYLKLNSKNS